MTEKRSKSGCPRFGEDVQEIESRKSRLHSANGGWYFSTREGTDEGPFISKKAAENAINSFIRSIAFKMICDEAF